MPPPTTPRPKHPDPPSGTPTVRTIQIVLGAVWIVAGALQYQPFMFTRGFLTDVLQPSAQGQPAWLSSSVLWAVHLLGHHLVLYNSVFATVQTLIGFGLLFRPTVKLALTVSFVWAALVWWLGEGLGMIPMGMASALTGAPGAVIIYAMVGALVWPTGTGDHGEVRAPPWAPVAGRLAWAALWLSSAAFWLLPDNRGASAFHDQVESASYGWLTGVQHSVARASDGHGLGIAVTLAVVSVLIGVGVLLPATTRLALAVGILLALAYWAFGQGFGQLTTGQATDVNAGPLYVLLALRLWSDPIRTDWRWARPSGPPAGDPALSSTDVSGSTTGPPVPVG